jgi:YYY domain-containing protein
LAFQLLAWWLALQLVALVALPVTLRLLRFLPDRGLAFARPVGLLLAGYLFWLLTSLGVIQNTRAQIVFVLLLVAGFSFVLLSRDRSLYAELAARWRLLLIIEGLFLLAFVSFSIFRAYNPDIAATEKPMEFAFINAILRSKTFPPHDPWLSGYSISYYYLGYVMVAMLTKLSGLASDYTFNLAGVTLFALTVTGAFGLTYNLVAAAWDERSAIGQAGQFIASRVGVAIGMLASLLVALMGNLEGIFELIRAHGGGSEALWRWLDVKNLQATPPSATWYPDDMWWWWRASRVIHDRDALGQSMEVIDEFPFFSFLLGDNHPHILTLPFVLLALALALNVLLSRFAATQGAEGENDTSLRQGVTRFLHSLWPGGLLDWLLWGLCLGAIGFLNTWDLPIYWGIFLLAYAIRRQLDRKAGSGWLSDVVSLGLILLVLDVGLCFPFFLSFRSQAAGIGLVGAIKTRLHQYLLMMGVFVYLIAGYLVALWARYARRGPEERRLPLLAQIMGGLCGVATLLCVVQAWWTASLCLALIGLATVLLIWGSRPRAEGGANQDTHLSRSTLFALVLTILGFLLTVSVEFIFLRDTFGTRMNTVFKFYYQAWVLLGLGSAYAVYDLFFQAHRSGLLARILKSLWGVGAVLLIGVGLSYTVAATASKAGGFRGQPSLDGTRYIAQYRPDDYAAIQWLKQHAQDNAVMLEAPGGSYSEYNWVSAHTGIPTLLGWGGHELQWRGNYDEPGKREPDIATIYQTTDARAAAILIRAYQIDYVYVGQLERNKYRLAQPMVAKFDRIMTRVYENNSVIIFGWPE